MADHDTSDLSTPDEPATSETTASDPVDPVDAVNEDEAAVDPRDVATHHDDLENPDAEVSAALGVDSLTGIRPQLRIN